MVTEKRNLFRKEALERAASPERLDQMMRVISPKKWLPLAALGSLVLAGLTWSIVGRIPITATGQGVLVFPSKVVGLQSRGSGQLQTIHVQVGDTVKKGEVIATIDQSELQKQLQEQRGQLAELEAQDQDAGSLQSKRSDLEILSLQQQRQSLQQRLETARSLIPTLKQRFEVRQNLQAEGALSADAVLEARQTYLDNANQVSELEAQLQELSARESTLAEQDFASSTDRQNKMQSVKREIAQLEVQLKNNSQVISDYDGRILELAATPGQVIEPGKQIGTIAAQQSSDKLTSVTFFPISEGKKVEEGMKLQVTPSTVQRERFGGIVGTVTDVSDFPVTQQGAASIVGNPEVAQSLFAQGAQIQVAAELQPDQSTFSGFRWSSSQGPQLQVSPGTTTSVRVIVEERAPITFVFPILKSWTGIY